MEYLVILGQGETSVGAYVPDLPGCIAVGETAPPVAWGYTSRRAVLAAERWAVGRRMTLRGERQVGIALVGLVALALVGRIAWVRAGTRTIAGDGRVSELKFQKHWVTARLRPGVEPADAIDLAIFAEFRPGMTFETAVAAGGPPRNIRQEGNNVYYEFWRTNTRVELGREESSSGDDEIHVSWPLYAYPTNMTYSQVVVPEIAKHVDPSQEKTGLTVTTSDDGSKVFLFVRGVRVDHAIWSR